MKEVDIHTQFLAAYDAYADAIFRHCYLRIFDRERAKDLMQETFTRAWQYIAEGRRVEHMRAFLYRTANNLIIDGARRQKAASLDALREEGFDPGTDGARDLERAADANRILACVPRLESPYRETITMRYIDHLSPKEIAEALGESENVISVRIYRGVRKLKELLSHYA